MSEVVKRCAACGKENPVSSMKTCMHSQMHYYVCDSKCMTDFYNPPKKPTERELRIKAETERDAALAELAALKGGREPVGRISAMADGKQYATLDTEHMNSQALVGCKLYTAPPAQASAWVPEGWKLVPVEPTEEMWGGLARDLMMWFDFGNPTVEALRKHLSMLKIEWPAWMDSESEMQGSGVPSKGTRATLIYKAMLSAVPTPGASDGKGGE